MPWSGGTGGTRIWCHRSCLSRPSCPGSDGPFINHGPQFSHLQWGHENERRHWTGLAQRRDLRSAADSNTLLIRGAQEDRHQGCLLGTSWVLDAESIMPGTRCSPEQAHPPLPWRWSPWGPLSTFQPWVQSRGSSCPSTGIHWSPSSPCLPSAPASTPSPGALHFGLTS